LNDEDFFDYLDGSVKYFTSQIVYWKDDRIEPNFILNLSSFVNLRSLHLTDSSEEQVDRINPSNHPHLVRLSLSYWFMTSAHLDLVLFGNAQQRFPSLQYIANVWCDLMTFSVNAPINTTIRHIHLPWATCDVIVYLVQRFPGLVSIDVTHFSSSS
jgi:hypothetical protein